MNRRNLLIALVAVIVFGMPQLVQSQKAPEWYKQGELANYPGEMYITGVGAADSKEGAGNSATEAVAQQLRVNIESRTEQVTKEVIVDGKTEFKQSYESAIKTTVNETVSGVEIVEQQKSGDTYYAFAALDKQKFLNSLRQKLDQQKTSINNLLSEADQFLKDGKIVASIDNYSTAQERIPKFYSDKSLYDAIANTPYTMSQPFSVDKIDSRLRDILSNITINITGGARQQAQSGEPLPEPIQFKVLYSHRGKEVPLAGVSVRARYERGTIIDRVISDKQGKGAFLAEAVPPDYGESGKIELQPSIPNLPNTALEYLKGAATAVRYSVNDQMPLILSVNMTDKNGEPLSLVNQKITRSLERLGHTVSDDAPLTLKGTIQIIEVAEVQTMGDTQTMARAQLNATLEVNASGEVIGSFTSEEKGLSTGGKSGALKSAYGNMEIDRREFSRFLARSEDKLNSVFAESSKKFLKEGKELYEQEEYQKAIDALKQVAYGQQYVREARDLMKKALAHTGGSAASQNNADGAASSAMASGEAMASLSFSDFNEGDTPKDHGGNVVVKKDAFGNNYATVFKNGAVFEYSLPQSNNVEVLVEAKIAPIRGQEQEFTLQSNTYKAEMVFNKGYYRNVTFGSTTVDIDRESKFEWENEAKNRIRFQIQNGTVKSFVNYKFFGAKQIDQPGKDTSLKLKLHQDDAIYKIEVREL